MLFAILIAESFALTVLDDIHAVAQIALPEDNITGLEVLRADAGWRNYYFLKVTTTDGITGWSEFDEGFGSPGVSGSIG